MVTDPGVTYEQLALGFFLSAINMGIFCGFDAKRVGRSFLIWFVIGFLLAPFGILIWLFMRDAGTRQAERQRAAKEAAAAGSVEPAPPAEGGAPGQAPPAPGVEGAAPAPAPAPASGERRYQLLTLLSKAAARNPGVNYGDLVERTRRARTRADFETLEREIRERSAPEPAPADAADDSADEPRRDAPDKPPE